MSEPQKRAKGILQNVITYLCFKVNPNSKTKLAKLVYLVDVYHYQMFGKRLTRLKFKHHYYGAWSPRIEVALEELYGAEILHEKVVDAARGQALVPTPLVPETTIELPESGFKALESVIADWGYASTDEVVQFTKTTLPFLNTPFGEPIDFSRSDPIVEYAKEHGISEEEAATEDILSDAFLTEKALEGDKALREGSRLLNHEEVFSK
jgi:hypothetical protein